MSLTKNELAQEIRRQDVFYNVGADELSARLLPFIERHIAAGQQEDALILRALVAAGHVDQSKVDHAREIIGALDRHENELLAAGRAAGGNRQALQNIAEGNLGDGPGQENYARIRQVAADALAAQHPPAEGVDAINNALDFEPDENHTVADMANVGYSLMQAIKEHRPDYSWNNCPAEIVGDLCNEIEESESAPKQMTTQGEALEACTRAINQAVSMIDNSGVPALPAIRRTLRGALIVAEKCAPAEPAGREAVGVIVEDGRGHPSGSTAAGILIPLPPGTKLYTRPSPVLAQGAKTGGVVDHTRGRNPACNCCAGDAAGVIAACTCPCHTAPPPAAQNEGTAVDDALPRPLHNLLHFTEHCISAAEEGVDYAASRGWLDAMTTMGIMEKVGRGKWAPTEHAPDVVRHLTAAHAPQPKTEDTPK